MYVHIKLWLCVLCGYPHVKLWKLSLAMMMMMMHKSEVKQYIEIESRRIL